MKAAIRRRYCSPAGIKIEEKDDLMPKTDEVLVRVAATTVNRTDGANLTAKPFIMRFILGILKPRKIVLGTDFAGEVVAVGDQVKTFKKGDRVFGFDDLGAESQAEFTLSKAADLFHIPEKIEFKTAVASLEGAHYAYSFIRKTTIRAGQSVLINGATGAIGSALLQFVADFNVKITATCDTPNVDLIKSLGADKIFDYTSQDFTKDGEKYDFIFDAVGKSTFGKCKPLLKEKGIYISSELGPYSQNVFYALLAGLMRKKVLFPIPFPKKESIPYIIKKLEKETFKPVIDRSYPLAEVSEAYAYVMSGRKTGNVLLTIG